MIQALNELQALFNNKDPSINPIVQKFNFYNVEMTNFCNDEIRQIKLRKNESKIIIIDLLEEPYDEYLSIIFDQTIIIISKLNISFLTDLLNIQKDSMIFTISNRINSIFPEKFRSKLFLYDQPFKNEYETTIKFFSQSLKRKFPKNPEINNLWNLICPIISSYFINKSYIKQQKERETIYDNENQNINLKKGQYITLQELGKSSFSIVELIYHIEKEKLYAVKRSTNFSEEKLLKREYNNLKNIQHPNISMVYGIGKIEGTDCIIIEYIRGKTLKQINEYEKLTNNDKIRIIFQLMLTIEFLQSKKFIYRDLKPTNLIINQNKNLILIDFDRMIGINEQNITDETTLNFNNPYIAPEINDGSIKQYSYEEDIYSIGLLIYFIFNNKFPIMKRKDKSNKNNYSFDDLPFEYKNLIKLCEECSEYDPKFRPKIVKLIDYIYNNFIAQNSTNNYFTRESINETKIYPYWNCNEVFFEKLFLNEYNLQTLKKYSKETNEIHLLFQFRLATFCYPKEYFKDNVSKFIFYFSNITNEYKKEAQIYLVLLHVNNGDVNLTLDNFKLFYKLEDSQINYIIGLIYYENKLIKRDINKAIKYFTLSADQNNDKSQFNLGLIYYENKLIKRDINKAIKYFTLSANQNNSHSQSYLGKIYYENKFIEHDIKKAIHYLTLSANQNNEISQFYLGMAYYTNKYIPRDINKCIYYFEQSANLNYQGAQYFLGLIYYENKYVIRDINKSIYYFTLSANKGNVDSQYYLGLIYCDGKFIKQDIHKSINYLQLAANKGNKKAIYYLGVIYYLNNNKEDIQKAIYYFNLALNLNNNDSRIDLFLGLIYYNNQYVQRDINKAIGYFHRSAEKNNTIAQYYLGLIYYDNKFVGRNIYKSIYYFQMAADKNDCLAQYYLGVIYYANLYNIERNINKSIHYFTLSSNANFKNSQYYLGLIYLGEYVPKDINKSIYYFKLSADQNNSYSQFYLGFIYYDISYGKQDIKKAIFYLTASANNGNRLALNLLGLIYIKGKDVTKDIDKGLCYLIESAEKKFVISCFIIGFIYHQGKYIDQDIDQAIHYYKEAINLNNNWARNNLAIIYKNGFPDKISPNIYSSIEYLNEAIQYKDDILSMYNLSHIYIFDFETNEHLDKAIELLMRAISKIESFTQLFYLLSFALVKKYDFNITKINEFLENEIQNGNIHQSKTYQIINEHMLYDKSSFDYMFDLYKGIDFLYNYKGLYVSVKNLYKYKYKNKNNENTNTQIRKNITREFYDGFGIDL